jgi:predicted nucleotidyltransferase
VGSADARDAGALAEVGRACGLDLVVLFGSRVGGAARPESDSDVGILRRGAALSAEELMELAFRIARATGLPNVDLVDLHVASPLLQHQAGSTGRALFESEPGVFNLFRVRAWKLYLDDQRQIRHLDSEGIRGTLARLGA